MVSCYIPQDNQYIEKEYNQNLDFYTIDNISKERRVKTFYSEERDQMQDFLDVNKNYLLVSAHHTNGTSNTKELDFNLYSFKRKLIDLVRDYDKKSKKQYNTEGFLFDERYTTKEIQFMDLLMRLYFANINFIKALNINYSLSSTTPHDDRQTVITHHEEDIKDKELFIEKYGFAFNELPYLEITT